MFKAWALCYKFKHIVKPRNGHNRGWHWFLRTICSGCHLQPRTMIAWFSAVQAVLQDSLCAEKGNRGELQLILAGWDKGSIHHQVSLLRLRRSSVSLVWYLPNSRICSRLCIYQPVCSQLFPRFRWATDEATKIWGFRGRSNVLGHTLPRQSTFQPTRFVCSNLVNIFAVVDAGLS